MATVRFPEKESPQSLPLEEGHSVHIYFNGQKLFPKIFSGIFTFLPLQLWDETILLLFFLPNKVISLQNEEEC